MLMFLSSKNKQYELWEKFYLSYKNNELTVEIITYGEGVAYVLRRHAVGADDVPHAVGAAGGDSVF